MTVENEWADPDFEVELDTREAPEPMAVRLAKIADEEPETPGLEPEVVEPVVVAPAPKEPPKPEVMQLQDGMTVVIEKNDKGWKATLDANTGARPEVFEAKTKDDLLRQALIKGVNATKKINQQNRQIKLSQPQSPEVKEAVAQAVGRQLTADEEFEFNADFKSNPAKAMEKWFSKRLGQTPDEVANTAKNSRETTTSALTILSVQESKQFLLDNPEYLKTDENFHALLHYLVNHKASDNVSRNLLPLKEKENELVLHLTRLGIFNSENLSEAYSELHEAGLLEESEQEEEIETPPAPVVPAPVQATEPPNPRIVGVRRQSRAANGLTNRDTVQVNPPVQPAAPSGDELDNLSDDEVEKLFNNTRRLAAQSRRN
jgi:hypothetical protein